MLGHALHTGSIKILDEDDNYRNFEKTGSTSPSYKIKKCLLKFCWGVGGDSPLSVVEENIKVSKVNSCNFRLANYKIKLYKKKLQIYSFREYSPKLKKNCNYLIIVS